MRTWWGKRRRSERGATTLEYGMLVAGIAAVLILPLGGMNLMFGGTCADIVRHDPAPARTCE